jgi:glycosyltransferase involved in cell wall biosynthesis
MISSPLVSICSTTYNREKYIGQAIDSWLSQETSFIYEIIISDDCSTDKTIQVIKSYQQKYPNKITLFEAGKNIGYSANSVKVYQAAKGKYIAHCDGDDYWIDSLKLQKQIDFLESNSEFVMCFTNSLIINDNTQEEKVAKINVWDVCATEQIITIHNSLNSTRYDEICTLGHMSSIVFRNNVIKEFPKWYYSTYNNDDTLFVMLSKYGKAKFINENCSVYRVNESGVSSIDFSFERDYKERIKYYFYLNEYLDGQYRKQIFKLISKYCLKLTRIFKRERRYKESIYYFSKCLYFIAFTLI